ncbi:hypothetical protein Hanom_Chr10g00922911 [Helianthus anomalus]
MFKNDEDNIRMLDPIWIVNMLGDIKTLLQHDIFYEDKDAHQPFLFQRVACFCYYRGIREKLVVRDMPLRDEDRRPSNSQGGVCCCSFVSVACSYYVVICTVFIYGLYSFGRVGQVKISSYLDLA